MIATDNEEKAIMECYRRLYNNSEPSCDFDELMAKAELNEDGDKEIPYNNYKLEIPAFELIVDEIIKEFKIKKCRQPQFSATIYLGCSPKFKEE